MNSKSNADRVSGAVFLIGLGILFTPLGNVVGGFFPGILFVIGASALTKSMVGDQSRDELMGGLFMLGLGLFFLMGFNLPLLLIGLGLVMLFGYTRKPEMFGSRKAHVHETFGGEFYDEKPKNDELV